jgi:hypothetical protein
VLTDVHEVPFQVKLAAPTALQKVWLTQLTALGPGMGLALSVSEEPFQVSMSGG